MLLSSTNKNEKVVLGLLSLNIKNTETDLTASEILENYRQSEDFELYLYKDPETDNFVGLLGAEHRFANQEDGKVQETILINRISVIPSFEDEAIDYQMYKSLKMMYPKAQISGAIQYHTLDQVASFAARYQAENDPSSEED